MRRLLISLVILGAWVTPVRADFMNALSAYDAGAYGVAFTEWRRLAEAGNVDAQVAVAGLYEAGLGTAQNNRAAAHWYERAARLGNVVARLNIGDFYSRGIGVTRDRARAWYWLSLAAEGGSDWARRRRETVAAAMSPDEMVRAKALLKAARRKNQRPLGG